MDRNEFAEKLLEIADGIDKIASSVDADKSEEPKHLEKSASSQEDFGYGRLGSKPNHGADPLLDFCLG